MRRLVLISAVLLVFAACGDTDESGEPTTAPPGTATPTTPAPTTTVAPTTTTVTTTTVAESPCPAEPFSGTIARTAEAETGDGTHVVASRSDGELQSAYAYSFGTGDTYTIYVGDHQIDEGGVGTDTLIAPPGGLLATIFLISDTQLEAGSNLTLRFVPIVDTGGGAQISGFGADDVTGSVTIIAVTDDGICFDIDTTDPQQRLNGTVSAPFAGS